jgi:adenine deaminase
MTISLAARIDAALGQSPADLVLESGRIVNVFTKEVLPGSVAIRGDRIVGVGDVPEGATGPETVVRDVGGRFLLPGYIDAHMHVGGSYLPIGALAAALLERGTTSLATDLYELYAMFGVEGVKECVRLAEQAGLRILFMSPVHLLGLERLGTFAHRPDLSEFLEMGGWEQTVAVNEPPPFVVLRGNDSVLQVIDAALRERKVFEGHAVGISGADLQAYAVAGASSDHEALALDEAREKLRLGYRILMREGSASRDLSNLAPLLVEYPESSRFVMVCTDEVEPKDLVAEGHVDHKLRKLVEAGVDPIVAVQTATINTAEYFGLADRIGSISPGKIADLLVVDELEDFRPSLVIASGRVVAEDGKFLGSLDEVRRKSEALRSSVVLAASPTPADFALPAPLEQGRAEVRVTGIVDGTLVSEARAHECEVRDCVVLADPSHDVLRVAVLERHAGSGRVGRGFMSGLGLTAGALAMTYCHVHQNLLVIGTSDQEMAHAAQAVARLGGGMAVVREGKVVASVELPVGGVLGSAELEEMQGEMRRMEEAIWSLGCELASPVLSIAFSALPTIPAYGLTDFGLYDVLAEQFVDVVIRAEQ